MDFTVLQVQTQREQLLVNLTKKKNQSDTSKDVDEKEGDLLNGKL